MSRIDDVLSENWERDPAWNYSVDQEGDVAYWRNRAEKAETDAEQLADSLGAMTDDRDELRRELEHLRGVLEYNESKCSELQSRAEKSEADLAAVKSAGVWQLKCKYQTTWREKSEDYWFKRLIEEVGELGASLADDHDDPPEWELKQIAAICWNWLDYRAALAGGEDIR